MSEKTLIQHCAPTLAGLKTGNLFTCVFAGERDMKECLRHFNRRLCKKGLRLLPIRYRDGRALIYVYRPSHLARDLEVPDAKEILRSCGYACEHPLHCVTKLVARIKESEEFPHEIGLFLGYPPEDVYGFIENRPNSCKCVGTWKVDGDEHRARKLFAKYKKCTGVYTQRWENGSPIEKLTVAG